VRTNGIAAVVMYVPWILGVVAIGAHSAPYGSCAVRTQLVEPHPTGENSSPRAAKTYAREKPGEEDVTAAMLA
jgi:hypothetical protein